MLFRSAANAHDGARLPELISRRNTGSGVWADTAYRSKKNEAFLERGMFKSNIQQKRMLRRPLPEHIARANAKRSAVRSAVEHVFAGQKHRSDPSRRHQAENSRFFEVSSLALVVPSGRLIGLPW